MLHKKENNKLILRYVLPAIASMVVSFTYNVVDGMFVGQGVGENALAAVNLTVPFTEVMTGLASMLTIGGATVMAIRKGRNENDGANHAFMTSATLVLTAGVLLTLIGTIFPRQIAMFFGATDILMGDTITYLRWYSMFSIFFTASILGSAFVRNDGSPGLAFWGMIAGAISNIFLDWLFVFPLQMGIKGAAIASGLGQLIACLILATHFIKKQGILRIKRVTPNADLGKKVVMRGLPEFVIQMSQPITVFCYNRVILENLGEPGLAAFAAATYPLLILLGVFFGISQGLQPLMGNSYGDKQTEDVKYFFRAGVVINLILTTAVYILFCVIGKGILSLFITDALLIPLSYQALWSYGLAYIPASLNIIYITYFMSTKNTPRAMFIACCRGVVLNSVCVFAIPALFGVTAIWLPMMIVETLTLMIAFIIKGHHDAKQKMLNIAFTPRRSKAQ